MEDVMIVKGILSWAKVYANNYDVYEGVKRWMVNVVPSEEDAQDLIDNKGLITAVAYGTKDNKVKNKEGLWEFRFKRKVELRDGSTKTPPVIVDAEGNPFSGPIGNGTVANVQYTTYDYKGKNYIDLQGIQILELVSYEGSQPDGAEFVSVTPGPEKKAKGKPKGTGDDVPMPEVNPFS